MIAARFNNEGNLVITASFDETAIVWDIRLKDPVHILKGHDAELSNCIWNYPCDRIGKFNSNVFCLGPPFIKYNWYWGIATGSLDKTVKLWDLRNVKYAESSASHDDEILDICFDYTGKLASSSSDCTAKVWDTKKNLRPICTMEGHFDEVSKVGEF